MPDRFDKFSERARRVLEFARQAAQRHQHSTMDTEHLLLGILSEREGVAAKALATITGGLDGLRAATEARMAPPEQAASPEPVLSSAGKRTIELAVFEARNPNHGYIGTEHLLLGLLREGQGTAASLLGERGVTIDVIRAEVKRILAQSTPQPSSAPAQPAYRSVRHESIEIAGLPPALVPLYTLVLRLREAKDAALFAGKSEVLAAVGSQEAMMQRLLEEQISAAHQSERRSTEQ